MIVQFDECKILCFLTLWVLKMFKIIHIKYVKPALTRGLTVHDCGGLWAGVHFVLP